MSQLMADAGPRILLVQPDAVLLAELTALLTGRYGEEGVVGASSSEEALAILERSPTVAVAMVELRLGNESGADLLDRVRARFPDVGRMLVGAAYVTEPEQYDESELLGRALASGAASTVVTRPWAPADDRLFPAIDDLLEEWATEQAQRVRTITVVSDELSGRGHEIRDLLARNWMAHEWVDVSSPRGRRLARAAPSGGEGRPIVLLHNGAVLVDPTNREIAEALGVATRAAADCYDVVIVGAGPAGLAAAVYGASEGLSTLVVEAAAFGGQAGTSSRIENYLGFPSGISGGALMRRAGLQAGRMGAHALIPQRVGDLSRDGRVLVATLEDGQRVRARTVILATGVQYRRLPAPGIDRLVGAGVYYGSPTVELGRVRNGQVYVVGAGNSAGQAAVRLAESAAAVTLVVRGNSLEASMSHYLIEQLKARHNVHARLGTEVVECRGSAGLEEVVLRTGSFSEPVPADALFVMIGAVPNTGWLPEELARSPQGFVLTGPDLHRHGVQPRGRPYDRDPFLLETSMPHVFAVGDVRHGSVKRVASAVGEGSGVVSSVHEALREATADPVGEVAGMA